MTLRELGREAGGMGYSAVSEAICRFHRHRLHRVEVRSALRIVIEYFNLET